MRGYQGLVVPDTSAVGASGEFRVPFGWKGVAVGADGDEVVHLRLPATMQRGQAGRLRLTSAIDSRENKRVMVSAGEGGASLGCFDLRFTPTLQTVEVRLTAEQMDLAMQQGLSLRLTEGTSPWWFLTEGSTNVALPEVLSAHVYVAEENAKPVQAFLEQMRGLGCVQPFGWMEGCVLDGQWDLHQLWPKRGYREAMGEHLCLFFTSDGRLIFEDPRSRVHDDRLDSIESTLMFAALGRLQPQHKAMPLVWEFWNRLQAQHGMVRDANTLSAEGSYTVAFPMALLAVMQKNESALQRALDQLRVRRDHLVNDKGLHLRWHTDGSHTFTNWCRGVAWYMLGLTRTLEVVGESAVVGDLRDELRRAASWAMGYQNQQGLWHAFLEDATCGPDTAGSAGIAAALAQGVVLGLLPEVAAKAGQRAVQGLYAHLTPDGLLDGVTQSNRGGEALQRGPYRVMSPMGMGMLAQAMGQLGKLGLLTGVTTHG